MNYSEALILALHCDMQSLTAKVEGMKVANKLRCMQGLTPAYGEDAFREISEKLLGLSDSMTTLASAVGAPQENTK